MIIIYAMMIRMPGIQAQDRSRWIALVVVCFGQLMALVDATIVNVALPRIQHDLHFTQASLTWVLNGLPDRLRKPAAARGPARRPDRPPPRVPGGRHDLHARVRRLRFV
jgi:hypothetical protein